MRLRGFWFAAGLAVVALALGLYWRATSAWFYQDDLQWLAGTLTFVPGDLLDFAEHSHFYRPVISLYFWAATPIFDGSPVLFHWANSVLHAFNGLLVLLLARSTGLKPAFALMAALFFVSMPAYVEAIAWVSALAEPVTTFFGIISTVALLRARSDERTEWKLLSLAAFFMALITHESATVLLPLLVIADWAFAGSRTPGGTRPRRWIRFYAPYALMLAAYLLIDLSVNRRSYLVDEGHYRFGLHAVENTLAYVVTLYVGERNLPSFVATGTVLVLLLLRGDRPVVFATAWMLLAILPFSFFTWSTTSRYAYMPAVGMSLLLAHGIAWLDGRLSRAIGARARVAVVSTIGAFVAIRFVLFSIENIENFRGRTEPYRELAVSLRRDHRPPPAGATLPIDRVTADALQFRYVEALVRWEFRDPTLRVIVTP